MEKKFGTGRYVFRGEGEGASGVSMDAPGIGLKKKFHDIKNDQI